MYQNRVHTFNFKAMCETKINEPHLNNYSSSPLANNCLPINPNLMLQQICVFLLAFFLSSVCCCFLFLMDCNASKALNWHWIESLRSNYGHAFVSNSPFVRQKKSFTRFFFFRACVCVCLDWLCRVIRRGVKNATQNKTHESELWFYCRWRN